MKTLLVKDYRILITNKKSLFFILGIGIFMVVASMDIGFLGGYMMLLSFMLSAGTVNYDELDGGMAFLMTLPANRRTYAVEKYLLSFINALFCGGVILVLFLITKGFVNWGLDIGDMLLSMFGWLAGIGLTASVLLPVYLKFSAEKRRVAIMIFIGTVAALFYALRKIVDMATAGEGLVWLGDLIAKMNTINPIFLTAGIMVALILCIAVSVLISIRIMQKKEF